MESFCSLWGLSNKAADFNDRVFSGIQSTYHDNVICVQGSRITRLSSVDPLIALIFLVKNH